MRIHTNQTRENEVKRGKVMENKKVGLLHSIRGRIIGLVITAIAISTILISVVSMIMISNRLTGLQESYMDDMAIAYGKTIADHIDLEGKESISSEKVQQMLSEVQIHGKESSYAYVVDLDGIMLYHPTAEKIGVSVENSVVKGILADIAAGKPQAPAVYEYDYHGAIKYAGVYPDAERGFLLIISADKAEINKEISSILVGMMICVVIALIIGVGMAVILSSIITKPIQQMSDVANRFSTLDLRRDDMEEAMDHRKDEVGIMGRSLSELRSQFGNVVADIKAQSNSLYEAATELDEHARETANNLEQVEKAVYEIAEGASAQAEETQRATENVIQMGNMVEETNEEVEHLYSYANAMKSSGDEASRSLQELNNINGKAKESIDLIYRQTNNTNESAMKIREATELITFIAEQTNLLSLNASIEAARAGEQGRGFAVVASQIQTLAEQSNESAQQIGQIINVLIDDSNEAVGTMNEVMEIMEEQNRNIHQIEMQFEQLFRQIDMSMNGVGNIADKTQVLDSARINVVDIVQNLTAIAEENAASTEETSASVAEVSDIVAQISENVNSLRQIAEELEGHVNSFIVE